MITMRRHHCKTRQRSLGSRVEGKRDTTAAAARRCPGGFGVHHPAPHGRGTRSSRHGRQSRLLLLLLLLFSFGQNQHQVGLVLFGFLHRGEKRE